jgi:hypothetical protein
MFLLIFLIVANEVLHTTRRHFTTPHPDSGGACFSMAQKRQL